MTPWLTALVTICSLLFGGGGLAVLVNAFTGRRGRKCAWTSPVAATAVHATVGTVCWVGGDNRMPSHNGFSFDEQAPPAAHSPSLSINPRAESRAIMRVWWPWEDTPDLVASTALLGWAEMRQDWPGKPGVKYIHRVNPYSHPDFPTGFYIAESLKIEGDLPAGISADATALFDEAKAEIEFVSPPFGWITLEDADVESDVDLSERGVPEEYYCIRNMGFTERISVTYQTIPENAGLFWPDGTPATVKAFILLFASDITLEWYPVPIDAFNEAAFLTIVGTTNALAFPPAAPVAAIASAGGTVFKPRPAQTLIMGVPEKKMIRMGNGDRAYHITLRLKFHPYGANRQFRYNKPGGPGYDTLMRPPVPNGPRLYAPQDWRLAFYPP